MADPLSLAAAAAGFVGLVGQLAQGVIKLKDIYTTIKEAPKDVADLCTKMESLQGVLEGVGDQIQQLSHCNVKIDTGTFRDVMAQCETSRYRIEAHVKKLGENFLGNRAAAVRFVFKKKEIQEMLSDVETCKSSLIIARQSIDGAISSFRHETLLQKHTELSSDNSQLLQQASRVETIVEAVSSQQRLDFETISQQVAKSSERSTHGYRSLQDAHQASSSRISESLRDLKTQLHSKHDSESSKAMLTRIEDIQRDIHTSNRRLEYLVSQRSEASHLSSSISTKRMKVGFSSILFSFSVEFSSEQEERQTKSHAAGSTVETSVCTISLPKWFVQDQYNLAIARSKNGWLFHPSVYRTVDFNAPFFKACRSGDLDRMKMLLTTKQAYLGDRGVLDSSGDLALVHALLGKQFAACKLLVDAGILSFCQSNDFVQVLEDFAYIWTSNADRKEGREVLRLIASNQNADPDWIDDMELTNACYKAIQDLRLYAEEADGSALDRFEALIFPTTLGLSSRDLEIELHSLSEFLGDADHVREIRAAASRSTWLLFALADKISRLFRKHRQGEPPEHTIRACRIALGVLCNTELDLFARIRELPAAWNQALYTKYWIPWGYDNVTSFAYIFARHVSEYVSERGHRCHFDHLHAAMRLWVNTLYDAGVDLAAYAENEVWKINKILLIAKSKFDLTCRLLHGPEPDDWKIETGPPGDACPAYFWRSVDAAPIGEELTEKVLDLMHQVNHPETVRCKVPGSWELDCDDCEDSDWIIEGWLAFLEDSQLAQMEADLERLDAKEFCEVWDISSVIDYWLYDKEDSESSEGSLDE